jgi:membrane protein DedA with SNARE-associated domain
VAAVAPIIAAATYFLYGSEPMDETTKLILKNASASVVRALLYSLATWLVSKNLVSQDMGSALQSHAGEIAAGVITFAAALAWSVWQKKHANEKVNAALLSEPVSREQFESSLDK